MEKEILENCSTHSGLRENMDLEMNMKIELSGAHFYTLAFTKLGLKNLTRWYYTSDFFENLFGRTLEGIELELSPRL